MLTHTRTDEYGTPEWPYYELSAPALSNSKAKRAIKAHLDAAGLDYGPNWRHKPDGSVYVVYCPRTCRNPVEV